MFPFPLDAWAARGRKYVEICSILDLPEQTRILAIPKLTRQPVRYFARSPTSGQVLVRFGPIVNDLTVND